MPTLTGSTSTQTWATWCDSSSATITGNTMAAYGTDSANNTITTTVWVSWNDIRAGGTTYCPSQPRVDTEAAKEARENAEVLLREFLTEEQRKELDDHQYFTVHSRDKKRVYRVRRGRVGNIERVTDEEVRVYCVHPAKPVPDADTMLAQALHLMHDDEALIRMANLHRRVPRAA